MKVKPSKHAGEVVLEMNSQDEPMFRSGVTAPFKVKTILVPVDFSDCSKKALQYALPLAKLHDAAITLVHIVPNPAYAVGDFSGLEYASIQEDLRVSGEEELAKLATDEIKGAIPADTVVRIGAPGNGIVEIAKNLPADLIVIATHGHTGLKHILLGSVAEYVTRHAPCPVLVVREQEHEFLAR